MVGMGVVGQYVMGRGLKQGMKVLTGTRVTIFGTGDKDRKTVKKRTTTNQSGKHKKRYNDVMNDWDRRGGSICN